MVSTMNNTNVPGLKEISYNVRGLGYFKKRREIFHYLHTKSIDIALIQENHSAKYMEFRWRNEWGSRAYFSHGTTQARGAMILISKNVNISVHNTFKANDGSFIMIDFIHE